MVNFSIESLNEESPLNALLYGSGKFKDKSNRKMLLHAIYYIKFTKHFERASL